MHVILSSIESKDWVDWNARFKQAAALRIRHLSSQKEFLASVWEVRRIDGSGTIVGNVNQNVGRVRRIKLNGRITIGTVKVDLIIVAIGVVPHNRTTKSVGVVGSLVEKAENVKQDRV